MFGLSRPYTTGTHILSTPIHDYCYCGQMVYVGHLHYLVYDAEKLFFRRTHPECKAPEQKGALVEMKAVS